MQAPDHNSDPVNMVDQDWLKAYVIASDIIAEMHAVAYRALVARMGEDAARLVAPSVLSSIVGSAEQEAVRLHKEALAVAAHEQEQQRLEEELRRREEAINANTATGGNVNDAVNDPW